MALAALLRAIWDSATEPAYGLDGILIADGAAEPVYLLLLLTEE